MSSVRARFRLDEHYRFRGNTEMHRVKLGAVQGEPFGPATPSGQLDMTIANLAAAQVFADLPLGTEFDVLITPVEQEG